MTSSLDLQTVIVNIVPPKGIPTSNFKISAVPTIPLRWELTGDPIETFITRTPGLGLTLPATDQSGFVTEPGSPFSGWQYVITISGTVGGVRFDESYLYAVKSDQVEVDLNILNQPGGAIGAPTIVIPTDPGEGGSAGIDDSTTSAVKVWSSQKVSEALSVKQNTEIEIKNPENGEVIGTAPLEEFLSGLYSSILLSPIVYPMIEGFIGTISHDWTLVEALPEIANPNTVYITRDPVTGIMTFHLPRLESAE